MGRARSAHGNDERCVHSSSLNVFDNGAVFLVSVIWTLSIVSTFFDHNVSGDGSSLVIR
jgi:hypothetical protein